MAEAAATILASGEAIAARRRFRVLRKLLHHRSFMIGFVIVLLMVIAALCAPLTGVDPNAMRVRMRFRPPQETWWFGTDQFGRDVFSRTIYGTRISLVVGLSVAAAASLIGLFLGLVCGFNRTFDAIVMRIMDGIMAMLMATLVPMVMSWT
jgi:peptide/nickel transport system permease protein